MKHYGRRGMMLAASLSALAGYVDAVGFLSLGGFFVSFMSGNTTRLGVAVAHGGWLPALTALGLIVLFVAGVVAGATVARRAGEGRRAPVLAVEAALLLIAAGVFSLGHREGAMIAVVLAMGVENAVFQKNGDVGLGLTYMTGALVKAGQRIATALHGGPRWDWVPYLGLWFGLCVGGALGALAMLHLGGLALWIATAVVACLALGVWAAEARAIRAGVDLTA